MFAIQSSSTPFRRPLRSIATHWSRLIESVRDPYRPELHYMRGPGPKWHAKRRREVGSASSIVQALP